MPDLVFTVDLSTGTGSAANSFVSYQAANVDSNGDGWRDTVLKVTLDPNQETSPGSGVAYTSAYFQVEYTGVSTGVSVNIGDSVTNDSWGGDASTQTRDAEIQVGTPYSTSKEFLAYGNDYVEDLNLTTTGESWITNGGIVSNNTTNLQGAVDNHRFLKVESSFASTNPTQTLHFTVRDQLVAYGNNNGIAGYLQGEALYALAGQYDGGPVNYDIYAAFNRVVAGSRSGTGVGKVTVILGTDDYILGTAANETFLGDAGNDYIDAGAGNDIISANRGFDYIDGGDGTDSVSYSSLNQSIIVEFGSPEITVKKAEGTKDTLVNVETLTASASLVDTVNFGNSTAGVTANLSSYAGVSLVNFDNIQGSSFDDNLTGNTLANQLNGGAGNDILNGGAGNDILNGGAGNDILNGGLNADWFLFNSPSEGLDTITDFSSAQGDKIAISKAGFNLPANTTTLAVNLSAIGSSPQWTFNSTTKILAFDSDGTGINAAVQIAKLPTITALSASNFVYI